MTGQRKLALAQHYLARHDPKLSALIKLYGPCRIKPHTNHYAELVSSIIGQQLSVKAAEAIWKRVLELFGGNVPSPKQVIAIETERLRAAGLSYAKAAYVKDLAQHIDDGRLDMAHITTLPNDELIEQLTAVKGIGEWSSHMFMIFSLGRLDILPVGDLGIRKAVQNIYGLKDLPGSSEIQSISEEFRWHPYESVAAWYLWRSLENKPG